MPLTGRYEPSPKDWVRQQVEVFEASGGTRAADLQGAPIVVVTSLGARSGLLRKNPLIRIEHHGENAVVASNGGSAAAPTWYHNLKAHPQVELQDGPTKKVYLAREATGAERTVGRSATPSTTYPPPRRSRTWSGPWVTSPISSALWPTQRRSTTAVPCRVACSPLKKCEQY
jgi:F420H(2)-dependent quinone reductase